MRELVGMQTYLYMADKMGAGQMLMLCASITVPRVIDDATMRRSVNELFRINDGLRARFVEGADGKLYEETLPYEEQDFEVKHFKSRKEMDAWGEAYATIPLKLDVRSERTNEEKAKRPNVPLATIAHGIAHGIATKAKAKRLGVDGESGVCTVKLVQLPGASGAIIKCHHVISDGWGMMVIANQFLTLLKGEQPLAFSFEEHLANEEKFRQSKAFKRDVAYFENLFKEHPDTPKIQLTLNPTSLVAARTTTTIDEEMSAAIRSYAANTNTSPNVLFLTAVGILVRRELKLDQFYLASVCANRAGVKERNTIGLFVNTPPLLADISGSDSFADAVEKINGANFAAFRHQRASKDIPVRSPQALTFSYQVAALEADPTAVCTQYYNQYMTGDMLTVEDRFNEGSFKMHYDGNLQLAPRKLVKERSEFILKVIREGIADDSKTVDELSA